jgi:hypothetical protein
VDFKAIAPIRFGFVAEAADQARRIASHSLKRSRRRMAMLAEARDVIPHLPEPGESLHGLMTGRYDLMHLIVVIVEMKPIGLERMRLATLSFNGRNLSEMLRLLDSGKTKRLSLVCSKFFAEHDKDLFEETLQEFRKRGQLVAARRSHCKVVAWSSRAEKSWFLREAPTSEQIPTPNSFLSLMMPVYMIGIALGSIT